MKNCFIEYLLNNREVNTFITYLNHSHQLNDDRKANRNDEYTDLCAKIELLRGRTGYTIIPNPRFLSIFA